MSAKLPLEGVRVVDFGWRMVAPKSVQMLAWGGAEVIRVESALRHDGMRQSPPMLPGHESSMNVSAGWNNFNTNKLSVSIFLTHPKGRELALRLVSHSDIVVENFSAGTMDKMGLGYDDLCEVKPDIIMASHWLTGTDGPWSNVKGHGPMAAAMAGMNYLSGYADRDPIAPGGAFTDTMVNPYHSAYALMAALHYRRRTGKGQYIDLAQYESIINSTGTAVLEYTATGRVRERMGNRSPNFAPQGVYRCQPIQVEDGTDDRWCVISVTSDQEWESLCEVIGQPGLAADPRFATFPARKKHEDEIDTIISAWTKDGSAEDVMLQLQKAGVPAGVVQNARDLADLDPQMKARNQYRTVAYPEAGVRRNDAPPFVLSNSPIEVRPAPMLGEHNDSVFKQLLNMTEEEINEGYSEGYIG